MSASSLSDRATHELFQRHPLVERQLSVGQVTAPYQIYDGRVLFVGGTANLSAVKTLLHDQHMTPLQTTEGKALMAIWVCDFTEANLGAHQELQISFFVSEQPMPPVAADRLSILKLISLDPNLKMLCHGLWNNSEKVVAYNRELLGLDAHLTNGSIKSLADEQRTTFRFEDAAGDNLLVEGEIGTPRGQGMRESLALIRSFGWSNTMKVAKMPYGELKVVNPLSALMSHHTAAQTYTKSDKQVVHFFDANVDHIRFGDARYQGLGFAPQFISSSTGCRFLYLEREPLSA